MRFTFDLGVNEEAEQIGQRDRCGGSARANSDLLVQGQARKHGQDDVGRALRLQGLAHPTFLLTPRFKAQRPFEWPLCGKRDWQLLAESCPTTH